MLDRKDLANIRKNLEALDSLREELIKKSRQVLKLSKRIVYAIHRKDLDSAASKIKDIHILIKEIQTTGKKTPRLIGYGSYKVAIQEYVEAIAFYEVMKNNKIPSNTRLKVDDEFYLMGLADLTGELVRKAINSAINEDFKTSIELRELVSELYDELLLFDFSNGELRKKFDSIKYDLKKLDDLVANITLNKRKPN